MTRPVADSISCTCAPPVERMSARSLARRRSVQNQPARPLAQQAGLGQPVDDLARGRAEQRQVGLGQRVLLRRRAQVRAEDVGVGRVEDGRLDRPADQRLRVVDEVGVERVVAGDQHAERVLGAPPGPPDLLPQGGPGAGEAGDQHRVEAADVDAELERVGGGQPDQLARDAAAPRARGAPRAGSRRGRPRPGPAATDRPRRAARRRCAATCSAPRRDRTKASVRTSSATRSASRSAASEDAARRTGAPFSPA